MSIGDQMEYRRKAKSPIHTGDVDAFAAELQRVAQANNNELTPEAVVEAARDPQSVMHKYFQWDDAAAAAAYRLEQARRLVRSIEVRVVTKSGPHPETAYTRKYHHVRVSESDDEPEARYVPLEVVTSRENYMNQVLANAERELFGWRERVRTYQSLKEFSRFRGVIAAIDRLRDGEIAGAAD